MSNLKKLESPLEPQALLHEDLLVRLGKLNIENYFNNPTFSDVLSQISEALPSFFKLTQGLAPITPIDTARLLSKIQNKINQSNLELNSQLSRAARYPREMVDLLSDVKFTVNRITKDQSADSIAIFYAQKVIEAFLEIASPPAFSTPYTRMRAQQLQGICTLYKSLYHFIGEQKLEEVNKIIGRLYPMPEPETTLYLLTEIDEKLACLLQNNIQNLFFRTTIREVMTSLTHYIDSAIAKKGIDTHFPRLDLRFTGLFKPAQHQEEPNPLPIVEQSAATVSVQPITALDEPLSVEMAEKILPSYKEIDDRTSLSRLFLNFFAPNLNPESAAAVVNSFSPTVSETVISSLPSRIPRLKQTPRN